ncbi:hypothetical protein [Cellulosimicrobium sp. CUA-896]|uniref:hypothetical protein n=1 Tax=Cellulosimicrobium sp. CUA-896 TaxID=1517881 RepID=UPI000964535F|nr:hypothetical protein [Cellulosimicrobium sp. CUA-896]OLT49400.1 hypothetical protein BJF88_02785 [Cellulosimicrobium sp. CUA-896]
MTRASEAPLRGAAPSAVARALRPFGYLLVGLVWTAIAAVVVALGPGVLALVAVDGTMELAGVWERFAAQPSELVALVLAVPLLVVLWGPGVLWYLPSATWPLAALSFVYVARSLSPAFAHERLSFTEQAARGATIGLPTAAGVALSLQPVRQSRVTAWLMRFYVSGWVPDGRMFVAMLPAGLGWLLALVGLARDVPPAWRAAALVVAALLVVWSARLGRRAWVRRFSDAPAPASPREAGVAGMTADQRRRRLEELRRARSARVRGAGGDGRA